ncbi:hypothetical protein [Methylosinus sp. Ce-a6]|uniref:hypothetical protein n=1 Tax=Methylosinus sp. Ce-a6 TaxID=2172005 RepID=UPI00135A89A3|nr:hypothetical protein [Methylosinus sp. Ce-a6]
MWRLFNALCMLSVVTLLVLHGGQARSLPERPQWRSEVDGMECAELDRGALGASARTFLVPASAGAFPSWTPPAEIEAKALVWRPPGEIASARAAEMTGFAAVGATAKPASSWAPPAEIATKPVRSTFADRARVWLPPADIAHAKAAGLAVPASAESPASKWARPTEIADEAPVLEHRSAFTGGARAWLPPTEIASARAAVDDIVTGLAAARASPHDRSRSNWIPPAEIAALLPMASRSTIANDALVWRPPEEIAKSKIASR